ncbi:MAG: hypothetical protein KDA96_08335 [Planctomycetaceae bacterium]|nr:hypothetical protein [Planctomycetaceae bacterium]
MSLISETTTGRKHGGTLAWISRGRLFIRKPDEQPYEIESAFARNALQREMRNDELNAWKGRSGVWGNLGMAPPGTAPWEDENSRRRIFFRTIAAGEKESELFYVLDMGAIGGLFSYNLEEDLERRLVHRQGFVLNGISRHPEDGRLAFAMPQQGGTVGLSIARPDGLFGRDISLSDSIDDAPAWLPDGSARLLFHSAALVRSEQGYVIGTSPYRIEMLDMESEEAKTVHEDDEFDLLQPRQLTGGDLVFIRRPWKKNARQSAPSLKDTALDFLLFPYRLLRTFVHFFNFMSMMFSGKPLITAGGLTNRNHGGDNPYLMLWGQAVDTRRALSRDRGEEQRTPIAPSDWQLIRRDEAGNETLIAPSVLYWDLSRDGTVYWTDGRAIYRHASDGTTTTVLEADVIERFAVLN